MAFPYLAASPARVAEKIHVGRPERNRSEAAPCMPSDKPFRVSAFRMRKETMCIAKTGSGQNGDESQRKKERQRVVVFFFRT